MTTSERPILPIQEVRVEFRSRVKPDQHVTTYERDSVGQWWLYVGGKVRGKVAQKDVPPPREGDRR